VGDELQTRVSAWAAIRGIPARRACGRMARLAAGEAAGPWGEAGNRDVETSGSQSLVVPLVDWLQGRPAERGVEHAVLIYGPRGEPLRKIRVRAGSVGPAVFADTWLLPPQPLGSFPYGG